MRIFNACGIAVPLYLCFVAGVEAQQTAASLSPLANSGTPGCVAMFLNTTDLVCSAMNQGAFQGNLAVSIGAQTTYYGAMNRFQWSEWYFWLSDFIYGEIRAPAVRGLAQTSGGAPAGI